MKIITLLFTFALISNLSIGQNFSELANQEFESADSYKPAEKNVLMCANYLFSNPIDYEELNRKYSLQYILKWMMGTPDYTFDIGAKASELTKGSDDLFGLYMAAMTKTVLENEKLDSDEIYNRSEKILVDYCSNPDNHIKPSKKIKKLLKESQD